MLDRRCSVYLADVANVVANKTFAMFRSKLAELHRSFFERAGTSYLLCTCTAGIGYLVSWYRYDTTMLLI